MAPPGPHEPSAIDMARLIETLPAHQPLADAFERDHFTGRRWWDDQREHLVTWFAEVGTTGKLRSSTARTGYNRLQHPAAMLWLAEALGEDEHHLHQAMAAVLDCGSRRPIVQCTALRQVIDWHRITELAGARLAHNMVRAA